MNSGEKFWQWNQEVMSSKLMKIKALFTCKNEQPCYFLYWYVIMSFLRCVALNIAVSQEYESLHLIRLISAAIGLAIKINIASKIN